MQLTYNNLDEPEDLLLTILTQQKILTFIDISASIPANAAAAATKTLEKNCPQSRSDRPH